MSELADTILRMVADRGPGKTVCPSEVARAVAGSDEKVWRRLMVPIRREAVALAKAGRLVIRRKGRIVDPADFKGIYRLGPPAPDEAESGAEGSGAGNQASVRPVR